MCAANIKETPLSIQNGKKKVARIVKSICLTMVNNLFFVKIGQHLSRFSILFYCYVDNDFRLLHTAGKIGIKKIEKSCNNLNNITKFACFVHFILVFSCLQKNASCDCEFCADASQLHELF